MASASSLREIKESLEKSDSTRKTGKVWEYVTTTDQGCCKCRAKIRPGEKVALAYDGVMAEFYHADSTRCDHFMFRS